MRGATLKLSLPTGMPAISLMMAGFSYLTAWVAGAPTGQPVRQASITLAPSPSSPATAPPASPSAPATASVTPDPATVTDTPPSATLISSPTPEPTGVASDASPTLSPTSTAGPPPAPAPSSTPETGEPSPRPRFGGLRINEVAWAGTRASAADEWLELFNTTPDDVDLTGWRLTDGGDLDVARHGAIPALGFYLMERTDDQTVADFPASLIYTGGLNNGGESLRLLDPFGGTVDTANAGGGPWPAGDAASRASMAR